MSVDTSRLDRTLAEAQSLWASPLLVIEVMVVLCLNLGPASAFVGLAILLVMIPLSGALMKKTMAYRKAANKLTDARVKVTGELVNGIRVIKFQGWESAMLKHLAGLRHEELTIVRKAAIVRAFVMSVYVLQPVLAGMGMFAVYAALGGHMDAAIILGSLAYMNVLRFPLMSLPTSISTVGDAMISIKRLQALLVAEELDKEPPNEKANEGAKPTKSAVADPAIVVQNATFAWQNPEGAAPALPAKKQVDQNNLTFNAGPSSSGAKSLTMTSTSRPSASFGPRFGLFGRRNAPTPNADDLSRLEAGRTVPLVPMNGGLGSPADAIAAAVKAADGPAELDKFSSLRNVCLSIPRGKLTCVVGPVGSGKSSLLMALAGEMKMVGGRLEFPDFLPDSNAATTLPVIAYCAQVAWIMNATVRENITLGSATRFDEAKYWEAVRVCALERDLELLANGDLTDIGERGINLSGGQKQRISLARAVYSLHQLLFLDDPLSAVDAHVGKHILHEAILGVLKGKTIVMATHQLQVLPFADHIVCLDRGEIVEQGSYQELLQNEGYLAKMAREYAATGEDLDDELREGDEDEREAGSAVRTDIPAIIRRHSVALPESTEVFGDVENPEDIEEGLIPAVHPAGVIARDNSETTTGQGVDSDGTADEAATNETSNLKKRRKSRMSVVAANNNEVGDLGNTVRKVTKHNLEEERATGDIPWAVYVAYVRNGGGWHLWISIIVLTLLSQVAGIGINLWLTAWTQNRFPTFGISFYLGIYFALGAAMAVLLFIGGLLFAYGGMLASRGIHEKAISKLIRAPVSFFDRTPAGRILNRFSRDVDAVDTQLVEFFRLFLYMFSIVFTTLVLIATLLPLFLAVCIPLMIGYYFLSRVARNTARELKRLDSNSRSPLYANFTETLSGLSTVRSYHLQKGFVRQNQVRLDYNNRFQWLTIQISRWLGLRIEIVSALLVFSTAMFAVAAVSGGSSPGVLGLVITYALGITGTLNGLMRNLTEMELQMNGVERLQFYIDSLPQELPEITEYRPPAGWPARGQIEFQGLEMRYSPDLPLVIKGINLTIKPGERIGVVGRTGSGKSSLLLTLFRLVEPCGGKILVDGLDISKIGLFDLRHALSIIPQDPVVFSGDLRYNLDPFDEHDDGKILEVLESCGDLKTVVQGHPRGLRMPVAENGENFSLGQRQLVCLARAMLKSARVLCLDEASASLDYDSDALLQGIIREHPAFRNKTIITIAHRLATVIDYDRILVLSHGEIVELGTPAELVSKDDGYFRKLVDETGESAETLIKMALAAKFPADVGSGASNDV